MGKTKLYFWELIGLFYWSIGLDSNAYKFHEIARKRAIQPTPFSNKWGWLDGPVADWAGPTPKNKGLLS